MSARRTGRGTLPDGVRVTVNREGLRVPVAAARLGDAVYAVLRAEKVRNAMVSLTLLTSRQMAVLNRKHLSHAGPTDIITFGFRDPAGAVIGDIYVCPEVARANAKAFDAPYGEELLRLAVHGALHVLGYEHPDGEVRTKSPMWKRQERLLRQVLDG